MASHLNTRATDRDRTEASRSRHRRGLPRRPRTRFGRAAAAVLVAVAWLVPGAVSAAQGLDVRTPYPGVAVAPGSEVSFDLTIETATPGRVDLSVSGVPQGWTATLRGGGFVVDGVQTGPDAPAEVTLEVDVPDDATGSHEIVVRATAGGLTTDLPLTLRIEAEAAGQVTLTTDFPSLRGPSDVTFPFTLTLRNDTSDDQTFVVNAEAPEGWEATATISGQDRAASALVDAGGSVSVNVEVTPPENVAAGAVTIPVTASSGGGNASIDLEVEITGSFAMTLSTPDNRLNTSGSAGGEIRQSLQITNTGTAALEGVTLSQTVPTGWTVTYEPAEIPTIEAGADPVPVTAIIKPTGDAIAGDYSVTIRATNDNADSSVALRVTVETSLLWGLIGVALIVAVLAGLWFVFQRYGRR